MSTRLKLFSDCVKSELSDDTVLFVVGRENQGRNLQRRRVHIYREGGGIETSSFAGGKKTSSGLTLERSPAVWSRLESVQLHIVAENEEKTDQLLDNVINAVDRARGSGGLEWDGYEWETDLSVRTPAVLLRAQLRMPVLEMRLGLVIIADTQTECEIL